MSLQSFKNAKRVHFIGIGGIGTSAVARMFLRQAQDKSLPIKVSGSDMAESEVTLALRKAGVRISLEENAKNIPPDCDLVIYTIAIPKEHPELVEAKKRGIPVISYPEALGVISKDKYTIAITGTHGKTTTTAMIAKIMMDAGLDPTVIIGSFLFLSPPHQPEEGNERGGGSDSPSKTPLPRRLGISSLKEEKGGEARRTNFVAGKSEYLVVEGCEYCRSFLTLSPHILVITNIDADHLDYYRDMQDIISAFVELAQKLPKDGYLIIDSHAPNVQAVVKNSRAQNGDFAALKLPEGFKLHIPGAHNLLNAKAAWAVAKVVGIPDEQVLKSLSEFQGTWRRFEYRGQAANGALVYDDYGHHPTEIEATLKGTRELFPLKKGGVRVGEDGGCSSPNKGGGAGYSPSWSVRVARSSLGPPDSGGLSPKIVVVFQPHLYSRTKQHLAGFGAAFKEASSVVLLPIYPAREQDPGDITSQMVVDELKENGKDARFAQTFAEAAALAQELSSAGDLILTLGAGETNKVADLLVRKVESS